MSNSIYKLIFDSYNRKSLLYLVLDCEGYRASVNKISTLAAEKGIENIPKHLKNLVNDDVLSDDENSYEFNDVETNKVILKAYKAESALTEKDRKTSKKQMASYLLLALNNGVMSKLSLENPQFDYIQEIFHKKSAEKWNNDLKHLLKKGLVKEEQDLVKIANQDVLDSLNSI